ncbi:MAG: PDZ domain-containing protein [Microbacteriaceae bacterium]|nr:PDZ domain-containing protein [Microbacteriaceae bacterium]
MLLAGIAIGAVVGGVVGGGASALVVANQQQPAVVQPSTTGSFTLNNTDTATVVSGVALAATPSVVTLQVSSNTAAGSGSGVIYSEDGYIITNAHVVTLDGSAGSNPDIRVWLSDGRILDGTLIGTDPFADLAVVKVEADNLVAAPLADANDINVGDLTVAIGAPLNLSNTVTSGVVSALHRGITVGSSIIPDQQDESLDDEPNQSEEFPWFRFGDPNETPQQQQQSRGVATRVTLPVIQTDASINPGNSGGALLNANAELIGINVAIASNSGDSSTAGSDGLGFAIPVNMVTRVADSLIAGERPSHGLLGINIGNSTSDTDDDRNVAGGLVTAVNRGGPAEAAGLKVGDVITAVNGIPADSGTTVSALIRMQEGGDDVTLDTSRGGVRGQVEVTLGTLEW